MINIEFIGHLAAFLTTAAFLVQAIKSFRTKDLAGISLGMYFIFASVKFLDLIFIKYFTQAK